jgi:hypothetical protein
VYYNNGDIRGLASVGKYEEWSPLGVSTYCTCTTKYTQLKWIRWKLRQSGKVIENALANGTFGYILETTLLCFERLALAFL